MVRIGFEIIEKFFFNITWFKVGAFQKIPSDLGKL
jgi:hypothetical protein